MHQVLEVLVVAACHRITGFVRIRHGIQKSIQGTFHKLHKRIFQRKLPGAAKYAVFQDMRHTCAVFRRGAEGNVKYLVFIFIFYGHYPCSCFSVPKEIPGRADILQLLLFQKLISSYFIFIHSCLRFSVYYFCFCKCYSGSPPSPGNWIS